MEEAIVATKSKPKRTNLIIAGVVITLTLIGGLAAGIILVRNRQTFQQKASTSQGVARVYLSPESKTISVGETFSVKVYFDTAGTAVSAMTIQLEYSFSGSEPPITATDVTINSSLAVANNWDFPIKNISNAGGKTTIRIAGFSNSISGYTTSGQEELATVNFRGNSPGTITVSFNQTESKITRKSDGADTLLIPQSTGTYTVGGSAETVAPTPTPSSSSTATSKPVSVLTPTPTKFPVPQTGSTENTIAIIGGGIFLIVASCLLAF